MGFSQELIEITAFLEPDDYALATKSTDKGDFVEAATRLAYPGIDAIHGKLGPR